MVDNNVASYASYAKGMRFERNAEGTWNIYMNGVGWMCLKSDGRSLTWRSSQAQAIDFEYLSDGKLRVADTNTYLALHVGSFGSRRIEICNPENEHWTHEYYYDVILTEVE